MTVTTEQMTTAFNACNHKGDRTRDFVTCRYCGIWLAVSTDRKIVERAVFYSITQHSEAFA